MGKKSRRQRQVQQLDLSNLGPPTPLDHRFNALKIQHKGRALSNDDILRLRDMKTKAREAVDATHVGWPTIEIAWTHDQLDEYCGAVAFPRIGTKGLDSALRALERWPRLQPYWLRLRRRVCDNCQQQVALSEPRYLVCGGCGVARYCCEECQRNDWEWHQTYCAAMARTRRVHRAERLKRGWEFVRNRLAQYHGVKNPRALGL